MQIYPVKGRLVRNPENGREIVEPTNVPDDNAFWLRRLADGDVSDSSVDLTANKSKAKTAGAE